MKKYGKTLLKFSPNLDRILKAKGSEVQVLRPRWGLFQVKIEDHSFHAFSEGTAKQSILRATIKRRLLINSINAILLSFIKLWENYLQVQWQVLKNLITLSHKSSRESNFLNRTLRQSSRACPLNFSKDFEDFFSESKFGL